MISYISAGPSLYFDRKFQRVEKKVRLIPLPVALLSLPFLIVACTAVCQSAPNPSALSFGNQIIGQASNPQSLTIKSAETEALTIRSISIGGAAASDFTVAGNCPLAPKTLDGGANCQITVTFTPSGPGSRSAKLTIVESEQADPLTIALTGEGIGATELAAGGGNIMLGSSAGATTQDALPVQRRDLAATRPVEAGRLSPLGLSAAMIAPLTLSPVNLSFASYTVGVTSLAQSVTLTNRSNESIAFSPPSASGDFAVSGSTCGTALGAGKSCSIAVTFKPSAVGTRTGTLTQAVSVSNGPVQVPLTGTGNLNALSSIVVTPANSTLNTGQTQQFTATGYFAGGPSENLTASVLWSSLNPSAASVSTSGVATGIGAGTTIITATMAVATPAPAPGIGVPSVPHPTNPVSGSTSLIVVSAIPQASLGSSSLVFESEITGNTSPSMSETLTNDGTAPLSLVPVQVTGPDSGDFSITSNTCGSTLSSAAGSNSCTVTLTFKPQGTGTRSADLLFTDNAGGVSNSHQSASLSSQGLSPISILNTFPPDATVGVPYEYQLAAVGGTEIFNWSLALATGQEFPGCLSESGNGWLVGNPVNTCVGSFTFNVKVTDSQGNQFTTAINLNVDSAESTVCESGNESVLEGQYAFNEIGFHNTGFFTRVGSFVADGAGNVVSGEFDRNGVLGSSTTGPVTLTTGGTYTVGQDNRGCITFKATGGGSFTWRFVLSSISGTPATAAQGQIIEFDAANGNAFIASGQLFQQTTSTTATATSFSTLSGNYVHLTTGWDTTGNGGRMACVGVKTDTPTTGGAGTIAAGEQYCNDEGVAPGSPVTGLTGSYTGVDQYGRFTESVGLTNLTGYLTSTAATGTVEITNSINSSDAAVLAGQTFQQQSPGTYGQGSLSGTGVYYVNGLSSSTTGSIEFALVSADGVGTLTLNADYKNVGGTWVNNGTTGSCTYTFEANGNGGASSGCGGMFYLWAPNTAVVVDNDAGSSAGYFLPQTVPNGGFTADSVANTFAGGTTEILSQSAAAEESLISLAAGAGNTLMGDSIEDDINTYGEDTDEVNPFSGLNISSTGVITLTQGVTTSVAAVAVDTSHFISTDNTDCSGSPTCFPTIELYGPTLADSVTVAITSPSSPQTVQAGSTLALTVAVTHTNNTGVTWTINGVTANLGYGTITGAYPNFTFNAPNRLTQPASYTLTATSNADVSQSASITVTITAPTVTSMLTITTTSLPDGELDVPYLQNVQTTGGTGPFHWSILSGSDLPPGVFIQASYNATDIVAGTPQAQGSYTFTLQVTDSSSPVQSTSQAFTVQITAAPLSIVTTSLSAGVVGNFYSQFVSAVGGTPPYTYTVASGSFPTWATLTPASGQISGTPTTNGTTQFSVKVTDSTLPTHLTYTQSLSLTVTTPEAQACQDSGNEAILSGQYAFSLTGFNSLGYQGVIGSFTADGSGHITAGEIDTNGILGSGNYSITTGSSSYSVGSDNLGCATLATSFGTFNVRLSLGTMVSNVATGGRLVEWDAPGSSTYFSATGVLKQQTAADFSGGLPTGSSYAFGLSGYESVPVAVAGTFNVNSSSSLNDLEEDENVDGTVNGGNGPSMPYTGYTGTYSTFDSNGRGTYSLQNGATSEGSGTVYMVSTSDLLDLAANKYLEGELVQQTVPNGGFSASSVSGNIALSQTSLNSSSQGEVTLGLLNGDGISSLTINLYQDKGGTWQTPQSMTCTYSMGTNGRMTLSGENCTGAPLFYFVSSDTAFELGTDSSMGFGNIEAQTSGPFSFTTEAGSYYFGDGLVVSYASTASNTIGVGALSLTSSGSANGISDYSGPGGQSEDSSFSSSVGAVNSNGTINFTAGGPIDGMVVSNVKFILVDNETGTYPILIILKQ